MVPICWQYFLSGTGLTDQCGLMTTGYLLRMRVWHSEDVYFRNGSAMPIVSDNWGARVIFFWKCLLEGAHNVEHGTILSDPFKLRCLSLIFFTLLFSRELFFFLYSSAVKEWEHAAVTGEVSLMRDESAKWYDKIEGSLAVWNVSILEESVIPCICVGERCERDYKWVRYHCVTQSIQCQPIVRLVESLLTLPPPPRLPWVDPSPTLCICADCLTPRLQGALPPVKAACTALE